MLTVEEAAAQLRIGRTKAYAMTKEWRASGGRSGLPVRDMGGVLRVPVAELERVFGIQLTSLTVVPPTATAGDMASEPTASASPEKRSRRAKRPPVDGGAQLGLFNAEG